MLFKISSCILDLSLKISNIDFGECYNKTKQLYNIKDDLVIGIIENYKKIINKRPTISFWFLDPITGKKLDFQNICLNDTLLINQNIESILNNTDNNDNLEIQMELIENNINIFDPNDDFYSDLCYHFISPIKKDIPLKDRLQEFYPNITLCDSGCKNIGINYTIKAAICECKYSDVLNSGNNEFLEEYSSEILDITEKSNIEVIKCVIKGLKYFKENYGGIIIISLTACTILSTIFFYIFQYSKIKLYIFDLTRRFILILNNLLKNVTNSSGTQLAPPKYRMQKTLNFDEKEEVISENKPKNEKNDNKTKKNRKKNKQINSLINDVKREVLSTEKILIKKNKNKIENKKNKNVPINTNQNNMNQECNEEINSNLEFFENYLMKSIEEMSFYDAYKYDKRTFSQTLSELILDKVMTINIFCQSESLKPLFLKIIIYLLYINLYFIINGFFFSEEYISQVYHLKTEEKFFSFVPRSINRFIYTFFAGAIIQFLINCFFLQEKRIKRIFIRNKENINELKSEIVEFINKMERQLIAFIIIAFVIFIISFFYVISFNYVYHFTQYEWIKSSIFIYIIIELIITILCFLVTCVRFISLHCKSEKLYDLSNIINRI